MDVAGKVALVTGGGNGIGAALARRFAAEGAAGVAVVDLDAGAAERVATEIGGLGLGVDVAREADLVAAIDRVEDELGPIDLCCSNAGIGTGMGLEAPDEVWQGIWDVNVMAHVYAARALVPRMVDRGGGWLLNTASAAGLIAQIGDAAYSVTKHAAVALAEWLAITYGDRGIGVSCLCPMGVNTDLLVGGAGASSAEVVRAQGVVEPDEVADAVVAALASERFLILPHPEVADHAQRRTSDPDRWLAGMRRLQARIVGGG